MPLDNDEVKIEVLRLRNEGLSYSSISKRFKGISKTAIGDFVSKRTYKQWWEENKKPIAGGNLYDHRSDARRLPGNRFILTSAQNNTFVHEGFLKSLETASEYLGADIYIGTFSYNKSGYQNLEKGDGEWFDPKIQKYIYDDPAELADGLLWCGELNILPTAVNPLSGFHSYTKSSSGIIPHAKIQLESLPTHKSDEARMLYTTGSVTRRNYIQKKAGQKASFHHIFGALLVEVDNDGDWFVRQLVADSDDGSFYDLDVLYTPEGVVLDNAVEAINWGDIHVEKISEEAMSACFTNKNSMLDTLKPKYQLIHDVVDFESRNHHNIKDPYFRFKTHVNGNDSVKSNIGKVALFLKNIERTYSTPVVVESNHDLAFQRWLKEADYKTDPANAIYFLENQLEQYRALENNNDKFSIFEHAVRKIDPTIGAIFLRLDESFRICDEDGHGIECGQHGHLGANGGRPSIATYQKLGERYNLGHSHTAAIKDGVYYAGLIADQEKMKYAKGPSSWSISNIVTYKNSKRAIVTIKNGKWRADIKRNPKHNKTKA